MTDSLTPPAGAPALVDAFRHLYGVEASLIEWEHIVDTFRDDVMVERTVGVFSLTGHAIAARGYAWSEPTTGTKRRFFAVLGIPPIDGALAVVRPSIAADASPKKR